MCVGEQEYWVVCRPRILCGSVTTVVVASCCTKKRMWTREFFRWGASLTPSSLSASFKPDDDRLVFVGDLVAKGPDSIGTPALQHPNPPGSNQTPFNVLLHRP